MIRIGRREPVRLGGFQLLPREAKRALARRPVVPDAWSPETGFPMDAVLENQ